MAPSEKGTVYRFAGFEVDPGSGEVRKHGIRIRVQDQPLLLLSALLERPGSLITRDELHRRLWPDDTFVDFENGLNTAAARLRQALGDSARKPRFIESVPRRGYRFIAAVETVSMERSELIARAPAGGQESLATGQQEIQIPAEHATVGGRDSAPGPHRTLRFISGAVLIGVASVALATWLLRFRSHAENVAPFTFSLLPPDGTSFVQFDPLTLSPDGRLITFSATDASGDTELWVRSLDQLGARRLEGTKGASFPFWSPDSRSIAFFANGKLNRVEIAAALPRVLCDAADGRGGTWNRAGVIVFAPSLKSPLLQVPAAGGEPKQLTNLDSQREEFSHRWPYFLPDGRHFLYVIRTAKPENSGIYVGSIAGGRGSLLIRTPSNAIYANDKSGTGYVLFVRDRRMVACAFDARQLKITGAEFPIAESINRALVMEPLRGDFSASMTGVLAYRAQRGADRLTWFDRKGIRKSTLGEPGIHLDITLSPKEREVSFSRLEPHTRRYDIWRVDRARGAVSRVTFGSKDQVGPVWSPDGNRIFYASANLGFPYGNRDRSAEIYEIHSDGGEQKLLLKSDNLKVPWSTDGRFLLYHEIHSGKKIDTWALPLQHGNKPVALLDSGFNQLFAVFSPDGKWVAYTSDESGRQEVYVIAFPPSAASASKWMVSNSGGSHPQWPGDGKQLYYLAPDKRIMAVPVSMVHGRFSSGVPQPLFQSDIIEDFRTGFAVTADGQRFLLPSAAGQAGSPFATVMVHWRPGNQD